MTKPRNQQAKTLLMKEGVEAHTLWPRRLLLDRGVPGWIIRAIAAKFQRHDQEMCARDLISLRQQGKLRAWLIATEAV